MSLAEPGLHQRGGGREYEVGKTDSHAEQKQDMPGGRGRGEGLPIHVGYNRQLKERCQQERTVQQYLGPRPEALDAKMSVTVSPKEQYLEK